MKLVKKYQIDKYLSVEESPDPDGKSGPSYKIESLNPFGEPRIKFVWIDPSQIQDLIKALNVMTGATIDYDAETGPKLTTR